MRLLVTGGCGFIGSAVVRQAIAAGHDVLNVDKLTYAGNADNIASIAAHPAYGFLQADIADTDAMRAALAGFRPDAVLNLAAESHVDRSIDGPADFIATNIVGSFRLLEAVREWFEAGHAPDGFRFLQISTDEVFGALGAEGEFDEDSPCRPNSPYAASKASADMLARAWFHTYRLPVIVTHCSNNYGPFQFPEKLIPVIIEKALSGEPVPVYGRGENVRDWLFVEDHAGALLMLAARGRPGETYMIGGGTELTNLQLIDHVLTHLLRHHGDRLPPPREGRLRFVSDRPGHDFRYAVSAAKLAREFGWHPPTAFAEGLARTVDWYVAHPDWIAAIRARGISGQRIGLGGRPGGQG